MDQPNATTQPPAPAAHDDQAVAFALAAARLAAENRAEDVAVLDLRGLSGVADFFVVATGSSERQMHAVLEHIDEYGRAQGRRPFRVANSRAGAWLLADYVDVVVHLFDEEHRAYYDLDGLWDDAPRLDWAQPGPAE
jgi:ribosome-associated protein